MSIRISEAPDFVSLKVGEREGALSRPPHWENRRKMGFLVRLMSTAAALWAAVEIVPGIDYEGGWPGLLGVALVFGLVNAVIRPILFFLTCPLVALTLGLFVFVLNAMMLGLTAAIAGSFGLDFSVRGFGAAFTGALVVGFVSALLNVFVGKKKKKSG